MIISGSHLNHSFMQKLQARQSQGKSLGSAASLLENSLGSRLGSGLNVDGSRTNAQTAVETVAKSVEMAGKLPERAPETVGQTVANEIVRRMQTQTGEDGQARDVSDLRESLGSTLDWITERFGEEAGAAAAGMMMGATSGTADEDAIGSGLLNTLKFIDRNFGYAAGDSAIARFNAGVNRDLNEYFDNGLNEVFQVADSPSGVSSGQGVTARFFARAVQDADAGGQDAASLTEQLLADLKSDLDKMGELNDLASQLEAEFNPTKAFTQDALAAYSQSAVPVEPQFTSVSV